MIAEAALRSAERFLDGSAGNETTAISSGSGDLESLETGAQRMRVTLVFILSGFVTIWLLCVGLIWHMRVNRAGAFKGDAAAARKVILPAYEPVLFVLAAINGVYIVFLVVTLATDYYDVFVSPLILESFYSGNQFMFVIVLVLMFEKSLSFPAVKRAVGLSLVLSYYTILYVWVVTKFGRPNQQKELTIGLQFVRGLLMLPFVYALIQPPSRATKRIIRELCFVTIVYFLLTVLLMILIMDPKTADKSRYVVYVMLSWVAFCPLVVWRVLKADTEYWRGVGQRACALQDYFQRENGLSERVSSKGLHVLIEMNRKFVIDFAYLELIRQLGVGSKSTVFQGTLKMKTHVAVKAYTPTSCSDNVVAAFSHEAAMCSVLNHPNIVKFHGMCVAPPKICLVFQLCQGSLANTLDQVHRQIAHPARQQLLISIGLMLDAARAVAYLHSFSPPFVHCDIKPTSFLVDAECNVQLSDFGESRCVANLNTRPMVSKPKMPILEDTQFSLKTAIGSPLRTTLSHIDSPWSMHMEKNSAEYTAPEIIERKGELDVYGVAADVYSLAITMWDILYPAGDKFPQTNGDHVQVIEEVLHGVRPRLDNNTPPRLRAIIERSWARDPSLRPSAKKIVAALEDVQEELCSRLVLDLMSDLIEYSSVVGESSIGSAEVHHTFPGALLVDRMIDRGFVRCPAEAIRMGNALMDSSVLHHVNHSRGFENSATARYYFAFDEAHLSLPSHLERSLERSSSLSQKESSIPMLARGANGGHRRTSFSFLRTRHEATCQCRQLGQRLVSGKSSRFRRRKQFQAAPEPTVNNLSAALLVEEESSRLNDYNGLDAIPGTAATMA
ncbi:hypothetical protein PC110_g17919 [Phytophthora cactorum]|uniref:Protein kinase domain-containing protein n=1 Tax=Phytophthora cactorum TaxID=29920 RepID=A0A329RPM6_9STRA|nr:hypothetical protein PC110_g17919 [Phytophthora cactorum]